MPSDYDTWKTRTPEDAFDSGRWLRLRRASLHYEDPGDVCGGCGYFIDECVCDEEGE